MHRILLVVEGQTERGFVEQVLAPHLGGRLDVRAKVVGQPEHKGGNSFERFARDILALLRQEPNATVSTFVDLYRLARGWPGRPEGETPPAAAAPAIERVAEAEMARRLGSDLREGRFIAYLQVHEMEALFFAGPAEMADHFGQPDVEAQAKQIAETAGGCEEINGGQNTHPARRLQSLAGRYRKGDGARTDAIPLARTIGVQRMRDACPRFNAWLDRLESLGSMTQA